MVIKSVNLETVCGITSTIPDNEYNEVAFAGKSNVGKSSLINALMNRKSLARISSQPGKTQTINFYNVNDAMYLVDLPGYGYANDYGFQYVFGTTTCLIYAAMINYAELKGKHKEFLPIFMSISALLFFSSLVGGNVGSKELYDNNRERYDVKDELIDSIPEDASVACDSFYLPHLAQRDEIYLLDSNDVEPPSFTDFVIVRTEQNEEWEDQEVSKLQTEGYVYYDGCQDMMDIYVSPEYLAEHPDLQLAEKTY